LWRSVNGVPVADDAYDNADRVLPAITPHDAVVVEFIAPTSSFACYKHIEVRGDV
jgi:hypothetical protein